MHIESDLRILLAAMQRGGAHSVSRTLDALHLNTWDPHKRMELLGGLLMMAAEYNHVDTAELALSCGNVHEEALQRALKLAERHEDPTMLDLLKQRISFGEARLVR